MQAAIFYPNSRDLIRINILVILGSAAFALYFLYPIFNSPYILNDDVRVFLFWVHRFQDSELFQNDPLRLFSEAYTSWGVKTLYWIFSFLGDPLAPARWLPIALFAVCAHYLFRLGVHLGGLFAGVLTAAAFMSSPYFLISMSGGIPRSFSNPMAAAFLYFLVTKRAFPAAILLFLQPLFYAPTFLICSGAFLLFSVRFKQGRLQLAFPGASAVITAIVLGCMMVALNAFLQQHPSIGPLMNRQEMLANKAALTFPGGRNKVFPLQPLSSEIVYYSRHIAAHLLPLGEAFQRLPERKAYSLNDVWFYGAVFFWGFIIFRSFQKKQCRAPELIAFMLSGILLFEAAKFFLFHLYFPMRYLFFCLPISLLVLFSSVMAEAVRWVKPVFFQRAIQTILILAILAHNSRAFPMHLYKDASGSRPIFEFIQTLPKDALIAAHPYMADNIPTFSKRKVFIMYEVSNVFFTTHWQFVQKRTYEFFDAYFAEDPAVIRQFMERNKIDYLLVDIGHLNSRYWNNKQIYFEPFESYLRERFSKRKYFYLADIPEEKKVFSFGRHYMIHRDSL